MYHPLLFFVADHEHLKLSLSQIILFTNFYILLSCSTENAPFLLYVCVVAPTFPVPLGKNFTTQQTSSGLALIHIGVVLFCIFVIIIIYAKYPFCTYFLSISIRSSTFQQSLSKYFTYKTDVPIF